MSIVLRKREGEEYREYEMAEPLAGYKNVLVSDVFIDLLPSLVLVSEEGIDVYDYEGNTYRFKTNRKSVVEAVLSELSEVIEVTELYEIGFTFYAYG